MGNGTTTMKTVLGPKHKLQIQEEYKMKLINLKLRNFKSIKDLNIQLDKKNLNIYGWNGIGKTTIFDAFIWLLFDKDSLNSSDFDVKPFDNLGNVKHMLEHEVSATIEHEGKQIELQKIYKEKWTKKRGQEDSELTGHITDYFINGVPKKLKEYKDFLSEIIDEDTFKIITNPLYFNNQIDWKKRRQIMMDICGEVNTQDIFDKNSKLIELKELLSNKSIEDIQAEMAARRRKLNEEIKSIPYRIDELSRLDEELEDINVLLESKKAVEGEIRSLKDSSPEDYEFRIRNIKGSISLYKNQLVELEQNATKDLREKIDSAMEEGAAIKKAYLQNKDTLEYEARKVKTLTEDIKEFDKKLSDLRADFEKVKNLKFDESSNICPTCHQVLPEEEIQKHIDEFNSNNQKKLISINQLGKDIKADKLKAEEALNAIDLKDKEKIVTALKNEMHAKADLVKSLEEQLKVIDVSENKEYQKILNKIQIKEQEIKDILELQSANDNSEKVKELNDQLDKISKQIAKIDIAKDNEKRVTELKERERELSNMIAELEKKEFLAEQFIITKSNLLEEKLNSKFNLVKFKLFETQINGGIKETFTVTVNGVSYRNLNPAARVNAGLEIINILTDYYKMDAPIFIDNREGVIEIIDVKSQLINLIVSPNHKELTFELIENREVA